MTTLLEINTQRGGPYSAGLGKTEANYASLSPLSFLPKAAETYPNGRVEAASVLFGQVRAQEEFGFEYSLGFRDEIMRLTDGDPNRDSWSAEGAGMTVDEAVGYAIEHLS